MNTQGPRILFLFNVADKAELLQAVENKEAPDTALRGVNHMPNADFLTVDTVLESVMPRWLRILLPVELSHLALLPRVLGYDFIIASDQLFLGYVVSLLHRILRSRARWIYLTMNSSTLLRRHAMHPLRLWLLKLFWRSYAHIACLSRVQESKLAEAGVRAERLSFVPFGVDAQFFASATHLPAHGPIASIGRDRGRDYGTLLKAAPLIEHPIRICTSRRNIPTQVALSSNVTIDYDQSIQEVRARYAESGMIVVVSVGEDAIEGSDCSGQTVILEALAAGRPVITTARAWIHDYFPSGQGCIVVPPHDPQALAAAVRGLWDDTQRSEKLALAGLEKVRQNYTTAHFAERLLRIVKTLSDQ